MKVKESLGIPNYGSWYIEILPGQNVQEEMMQTHQFINLVLSTNIPEFEGSKKIEFINYGSTQLVYVLTVNEERQYTFLVSQPAIKLGTSQKEFDNLRILSKNNDNVIKPIYYFMDEKNLSKELYVTPYDYQSRCIGVETEWGMWVPEPEYHFVEFKDIDRKIINSVMIAMLIKFYDEESKKGIVKCRLDGGDFMIEKGFENHDINYENILQRIKLIAARELMTMELGDYINLLKLELSEKPSKSRIILGKKLRRPFDNFEIEYGIKLGLQLREKEKTIKLSRKIK